jgi:hypothetical protein
MGEEKNPHVAGLTSRGFQDTEKKIPAIARFFQRSYFSRLWVVQKVSVAQKATLLCGRDASMAMATFVDVNLFLSFFGWDAPLLRNSACTKAS